MTLLGRKPDENGNPSTGTTERTTSEHPASEAGHSEINDDLPF